MFERRIVLINILFLFRSNILVAILFLSSILLNVVSAGFAQENSLSDTDFMVLSRQDVKKFHIEKRQAEDGSGSGNGQSTTTATTKRKVCHA